MQWNKVLFWKHKFSLKDSIVGVCCKRTRDAIAENEDIENVADRSKVMSEVLNAVVTYLEGIFGSDNPSNKAPT